MSRNRMPKKFLPGQLIYVRSPGCPRLQFSTIACGFIRIGPNEPALILKRVSELRDVYLVLVGEHKVEIQYDYLHNA